MAVRKCGVQEKQSICSSADMKVTQAKTGEMKVIKQMYLVKGTASKPVYQDEKNGLHHQ